MFISVQNNDEIVRRVKWYLIICLEILRHLKGSLSEKLLGMVIRFPIPKLAGGAAPAGTTFQPVWLAPSSLLALQRPLHPR